MRDITARNWQLSKAMGIPVADVSGESTMGTPTELVKSLKFLVSPTIASIRCTRTLGRLRDLRFDLDGTFDLLDPRKRQGDRTTGRESNKLWLEVRSSLLGAEKTTPFQERPTSSATLSATNFLGRVRKVEFASSFGAFCSFCCPAVDPEVAGSSPVDLAYKNPGFPCECQGFFVFSRKV